MSRTSSGTPASGISPQLNCERATCLVRCLRKSLIITRAHVLPTQMEMSNLIIRVLSSTFYIKIRAHAFVLHTHATPNSKTHCFSPTPFDFLSISDDFPLRIHVPLEQKERNRRFILKSPYNGMPRSPDAQRRLLCKVCARSEIPPLVAPLFPCLKNKTKALPCPMIKVCGKVPRLRTRVLPHLKTDESCVQASHSQGVPFRRWSCPSWCPPWWQPR